MRGKAAHSGNGGASRNMFRDASDGDLIRWEQRVLGSSGWRRGVTGCGDRLPKGGHIENCFDLVRHCRSMLSDAIMDN